MGPETTSDAAAGAGDRIFLVGFMGCGKSRVGSLLADRLRRGFHDLDAAVEGKAGKPIRRIFEEDGEDVFRDLEHRCLCAVEAWPGLVVATGGGSMASERNRRVMRRLGTTVWLDIPFDVIVGRMSDYGRARRPLLADLEAARRLYAERRADYARADLRIAGSAAESADDAAGKIHSALRSLGPSR